MPKTEAMKTKEITVIPPEGYEIDEQNSTLQRIVFKEKVKEKVLPKTWEELGFINGYWINNYSELRGIAKDQSCSPFNMNMWPTYEEAKASLALAQLCQLRDRYNDGWKPSDMDWYENKSTISIVEGAPFADISTVTSRVLTFKTSELRNEFLQNFRDLIEIARPLL